MRCFGRTFLGPTGLNPFHFGALVASGIGLSAILGRWCAKQKAISTTIANERQPMHGSFDVGRRYDRVWTDFRDLFGTVWSLRVMERVNETARLQQWNWELTWSGFTPARNCN